MFFTGDKVKLIDSNLLDDKFAPMQLDEVFSPEDEQQLPEEELEKLEAAFQMNHTLNSSDSLHKMQSQAETILENAMVEANEIKMAAIKEAGDEISQLKEEARKSGYQEGLKQGQEELQSKMDELAKREEVQDQEFEERILELQSNVSEIIVSLVNKITGVAIEGKNIVSYLVREAIKGQSSCNEYLIQVSKEDYPEVYQKIDDYKELVKRSTNISVEENPDFEKNQCLIITDKNIIDCGLETKLSNLTEALKLLSLN